MNKTAKSTTSNDSSIGSNSPVFSEGSTVGVENTFSSLITTEQPTTPAKSTQHKKKETVEDCKAWKAAKAIIKQAAKTKPPEAG